jgi:hypothetical protein
MDNSTPSGFNRFDILNWQTACRRQGFHRTPKILTGVANALAKGRWNRRQGTGRFWPFVAQCPTNWPNLAHPAEHRINNLQPLLLILKGLFYLDTVEVWRSSRHGPTMKSWLYAKKRRELS